MRKLTDSDINKLKMLYGNDKLTINNEFFIVVTLNFNTCTIYNSDGLSNLLFRHITPIAEKVSLGNLHNSENIILISKYGIFETQFDGIKGFCITENKILLNNKKSEQYIMDLKGETNRISKYQKYRQIVYLGHKQYGLQHTHSGSIYFMLDIIDDDTKLVRQNVLFDTDFKNTYGLKNGQNIIGSVLKLNKPIPYEDLT